MAGESGGPEAIRSLAVTGEDVVAAVETNRTTDREAVLRVTPPFSARMRARLHVVSAPEPGTPQPVHVDPAALLGPDAPPYPRPSDTEDAIRTDPEQEYTVERHREYHAEAVDAWRGAVRDAIRECATIDTPAGPTEVDVYVLG
jgi:hypothetical protein